MATRLFASRFRLRLRRKVEEFDLTALSKTSSTSRSKLQLDDRPWLTPEKRGGLKGSMQHWLAVYPPEFEIPTFFVAVDSDAGRSRTGPTGSSRTDPLSSAD